MDETARLKVLVVEDEWLIAQFLVELLQGLGYDVLGPAPSVEEALDLISQDVPDAAILDISLGRENSLPVADELMRKEIPFVFASGYIAQDLPERFAKYAVLAKPTSEGDLRMKLRGIISTTALKVP